MSRRQRRLAILIASCALVLAGTAAGLYWAFTTGLLGSRVEKIAVLEFDLAGLSPDRSAAVSLAQRLVEMICQLSGKECQPSVILRDDLVRRGILPRNAVMNDTLAAEVARALGVSKIVVGTATFTEGVVLSARLVDARRPARVVTGTLDGRSTTEVRGRMGVLVYQLLGSTENLRNLPPEAVVTWERSPAALAQPVPAATLFRDEEITLSAERSRDPDGKVVRYEWDLTGDGRVNATQVRVTTRVPTQIPGEVVVLLTVEDDMGARTTSKVTFLILADSYSEFRAAKNAPPVARAEIKREISADVRPPQVLIGEPLTLDARASSDPDGTIVRYEWDVHADGTIDSTSPTFSTTKLSERAGTAIVVLTVTDDLGARSSTQLAVDVSASTYKDFLAERNAPPIARAEVRREIPADASPPAVMIGEPLTLDGRRSSDPDGRIVRHEWDIHGNGTIDSTAQTFTTTRLTESAGTAIAVLTVTDDLGAQSSTQVVVEVSAALYRDFLAQRNTPPVPRVALVRSEESLKAASGIVTRVFLSESLKVSAADSYDPDPSGMIVRYEWDLDGDGASDEFGPVIDISRVALSPGRKTVTLIVTDDLGARASQSLVIEVLPESLQQRQQKEARWSLFWGGLALALLLALGVLSELGGW